MEQGESSMPRPSGYVEIKPNVWRKKTKKGTATVSRSESGWWIWKAVPTVKKWNDTVSGKAQSYQGAATMGSKTLNKFLF